MSLRNCNGLGCPKLIPQGQGKCKTCAREYEQARGTSTQRGYDYSHQRTRKQWKPSVESGTVRCRRCNTLITADAPWDLGHPDADCPKPIAPEHGACNRATAGR